MLSGSALKLSVGGWWANPLLCQSQPQVEVELGCAKIFTGPVLFDRRKGMLTPNLSTPFKPSQTAPLTSLLTPPVTPPLLPPPTPPLLTTVKPLLTPAHSPTLTPPCTHTLTQPTYNTF